MWVRPLWFSIAHVNKDRDNGDQESREGGGGGGANLTCGLGHSGSQLLMLTRTETMETKSLEMGGGANLTFVG